jgi:GrpB-like predicted nucleotidyltransferase (UPF0157 family)
MDSDPVEFVEFVDEREVRETVLMVFDDLRVTLEKLLPSAEIEHIGSTSTPGAITKGDLDICVLVERSDFKNADGILGEHFARNDGSDRTESLSSFVDDSKAVPVGVQLVVRGGREDFFVRWRELLRGSPQVLRTYNELKRRWHGRSQESYRMEKSIFIERELQLSREGRDAG